MRRTPVVLLGVMVLCAGVCAAQDSGSDGKKIWVPLPAPSQGGYKI